MKTFPFLIAPLLIGLTALGLLATRPAGAQTAAFHIVSDGTARYSYTQAPGWETLDFDDSAWPFVVAPSAGLCPAPPVPPGAPNPIWGEDPEEFQTIFVRKTFTLEAAATAHIIAGADDDYDLFINGVLIGGNHDGFAGTDLYTHVPLQAGLNVIAMTATDVVGGCQWLSFDIFPPPIPPANDDVADAVVISALDFTDARDTRGATTAPDDPGGCSGGTNVWYTFTPSEDTLIRLTTAGSSYDAVVDVFVSSAGGLSHTGQCATGRLDVQVSAGTTYYFMVSAPSFGGDLVFSVQGLGPPIGAISGRVVDAASGAPLSGEDFPFAFVELYRCDDAACGTAEFVNWQAPDNAGRFRFEQDFNSFPLLAGTYQVRAGASGYVPGQTDPFVVREGEDHDVGDLPLTPLPRIGSIGGRVVDASSGEPLPGDLFPFAFVELYRCSDEVCGFVEFVSGQATDQDGRFRFDQSTVGVPLLAGTYQILAFAQQYQQGQTDFFGVAEGEDHEVGDLPLTPFTVQFSEVQPCPDLSLLGGTCAYRVRIRNTDPATPLQGLVWSIVQAGFTQFQTGAFSPLLPLPHAVRLDPGESQILPFAFEVPGTVPDGTFICPQVFVGQEPAPFFHVVGQAAPLFCLAKGVSGFAVVPEEQARARQRQQQGREAARQGRDKGMAR